MSTGMVFRVHKAPSGCGKQNSRWGVGESVALGIVERHGVWQTQGIIMSTGMMFREHKAPSGRGKQHSREEEGRARGPVVVSTIRHRLVVGSTSRDGEVEEV